MPYVYQEFPKYKYHPTKEPVVVADAEEEARLGKDWQDRPVNYELEMERIRAASDKCLLGPRPLPQTEQQLQTMEQLRAQVNQIFRRKAYPDCTGHT